MPAESLPSWLPPAAGFAPAAMYRSNTGRLAATPVLRRTLAPVLPASRGRRSSSRSSTPTTSALYRRSQPPASTLLGAGLRRRHAAGLGPRRPRGAWQRISPDDRADPRRRAALRRRGADRRARSSAARDRRRGARRCRSPTPSRQVDGDGQVVAHARPRTAARRADAAGVRYRTPCSTPIAAPRREGRDDFTDDAALAEWAGMKVRPCSKASQATSR